MSVPWSRYQIQIPKTSAFPRSPSHWDPCNNPHLTTSALISYSTTIYWVTLLGLSLPPRACMLNLQPGPTDPLEVTYFSITLTALITALPGPTMLEELANTLWWENHELGKEGWSRAQRVGPDSWCYSSIDDAIRPPTLWKLGVAVFVSLSKQEQGLTLFICWGTYKVRFLKIFVSFCQAKCQWSREAPVMSGI